VPPLSFLWEGPESSRLRVVLTHGAGGPVDSPFLDRVARGLADAGHRVGRFELPYMRRRREDGRRRRPDPPAVLEGAWREAVAALGGPPGLVIGGKSMGGRIASMVADELGVAGLVCLGYPFHPPGRPERLRTAHLAELHTPALFVQGERDPFGGRQEVAAYALSPAIEVAWMPDGDHSFVPRRASGESAAANLEAAVEAVAGWLARR